MAYWNNISNQLRPVISTVGDGINTAVPPRDIKDTQSPDSVNINTYEYPAMTVRKALSPVGAVHAIGKSLMFSYKGEKLLKIVSNTLYELVAGVWTTRATLPTSALNILNVTNFMDKLYLTMDNSKVIEVDSSWTVTVLSEAPKAIDIAAHANRLYAIYDNLLHYSGLREVNNWNTVNESGTIQVDTVNGEDLTAITMFSNHIVTYSKNGVYELYGTGPINYEPVTISRDIGCVAARSIVELKQNLFWLGTDGVYVYNGGTIPKKISWPAEKYFKRINPTAEHKACAGSDGRRYFIAIPVDSSTVNNLVLVYDTEVGEWYVHDYEHDITQFMKYQEELYHSSSTQVFLMEQEPNTDVEWYWTSKPFSDGDTSKRVNWYKLYMIVDLPVGSTLKVYLSLSPDEDDWELLDTITPNTDLMRYKLIVPLGMAYDVDWVRIKLEGVGPCIVHEIQRYLRAKPW